MFAGSWPVTGRDLGRQQIHDDAVLVRRPDRAIVAQEGCAGAFFTAKAVRAVNKAIDKPFEANRHFGQLAVYARAATRSIIELETSVLPMAASSRQFGRFWKR